MKYILNKTSVLKLVIPVFILVIAVISCTETNKPETEQQHIVIHFKHMNNNSDLQFDTMIYINEAGNKYLVNEIQYFISDIKLYQSNGTVFLIDDWKDIHYVDTDIPSTHTWTVFDEIPAGNYDSIGFTFGINQEKNQSFMFVNPPERDMFWPEFLGGGYHYMKLNGKWLDTNNFIAPFDFHMGIGQIYHSYPDSITGFVHNDFEVSLPNSSFTLHVGETKEFDLIMNIQNWFNDPHTYNHNVWGGYIMQNQDAMKLASENGYDVFTLEIK